MIATESPRLGIDAGVAQPLVVREHAEWPNGPDFDEQYLQLWKEQRFPLPFTHPRWVRSWWKHFGPPRRLVLLTAERAGQLRAVVPLYADALGFPPGRLRIVGFGTTNDYNDWLMPGDASEMHRIAAALFDHLARRPAWSLLEINGVRRESAFSSMLSVARATGLIVSARVGQPCPVTHIQGTWPDYLATRGRTLKYHLRSRLKRLAESGRVEFRRASLNEIDRLMDESVRLHALRWDGEFDDSVYSSNDRGRAFYRDVMGDLMADGLADVTNLYVGPTAIASVVGFTIENTYYYYVPAYDPAHNANVPGKLIVGHLMERAFADGRERFDFMLGDESYKSEWATESPRVATITLAPRSALGKAGLGSVRALRWGKSRLRGSATAVRVLDWLRARAK